MKLVWCAYFVILPTVKCFFSYCDKNESLLIPKGSSATFSAEQPIPSLNTRLYKFNETRYHIFHVYPYRPLYNRHFEYNETRYRMFDSNFYSNAAVHFNDPWIENKTRVTGDLTNITITIHDLEKEDNGTYVLHLRDTICFVLFVVDCDKNESLLIPKGSSATFSAEPATPFQSLRLYKFNETRYHIFHVYPYRRLYNRHFENNETRYRMFDFYSNAAFHFNDPWIENKTRVTGDLTNITITIHDLEKEDNGTYVLHLRDTICFVLFVVGINKEPVGPIEEHSPAYFYAYPKASVINRPIINATMIWLVDGKDITQSPLFVIQDGMIWLASVSRSLDRRNVTYRAVQDNGIVTEVNYTIDVLYGPEEPLEFSPDTDHYFLTSGNIMPEISCSVNCSPLCNVSWNTHGTGNILSIGKVRSSLTGTYTCTATRPGTDVVVKRRLIVQVEDTSAFTIAVAVLASIQAVTTTILVIFGIFIYTRSNASPCKSSKNSYPRDNGDRETSPGQINEESDINDIAQEQYEELTSEVRNDPNHEYYERLKTAGKNDEILYYENTKKARY